MWIALLVAVLLAGLSLIRIGAMCRFGENGLEARILAGPFSLKVYPLKKRRKKMKQVQAKPRPEHKTPPGGRTSPGSIKLLKKFLPIAAQAAGELRQKIRINRLEFHLTAAAADPAGAALAYSGANAALGIFLPLFEQNFDVKERDIRVRVDFQRTRPTAEMCVAATMTVGQGAVFCLRLAQKLLPLMKEYRQKARRPAEG